MTDQLIKALVYDNQVRIFVMNGRETVEYARNIHDTWHTATAAMGRALIGTGLLAANLKGRDQLSIQINGSGPIGQILINGDGQGNLRGTITQPHVSLDSNLEGKIDVKSGVGLPGSLIVSKYIEDYAPFRGQVPLVSGEIAEDLTYYMAVSEQTPSSIGLSVLVDTDESVIAAGGFFIQVMPEAEEETIQKLEEAIGRMQPLSHLMTEIKDLEDLIPLVTGCQEYRIIGQSPVTYLCPCSQEYYAERLALLDPDTLRELIDEDHRAEIVCHYCQRKYKYQETELEAIYQLKQHDRKGMNDV